MYNNEEELLFHPLMRLCYQMLPPHCLTDKPINSVTTKFVRQSTNKIKCPIFCVRVSFN